MITEHIIKDLEKELKDRDEKIKQLKRKNHELNCIKNDWIEKDLVDPPKKFPEDYIKQKKEFADTIMHLKETEHEVSELLKRQEEKYTKEIKMLKWEIEMLKEERERKGFFKKLMTRQ